MTSDPYTQHRYHLADGIVWGWCYLSYQGFIRINAVRLRAYNALQRKFAAEGKKKHK